MTNVGPDMEGKVAIVTGSQGGIGLQTAAVLVGAGASVVLADLPGSALEEAAASLGAGDRVAHRAVDISDEASVRDLVGFTIETYGRLDALDNNAARQAQPGDVDVTNMDVDVWDRIFAVNVRGGMLMSKHAIPEMIKSGGGSIVFISSGKARAGGFNDTAYGSTKGAIESMTRYIATQYGAQGVRCNAVAPGVIMSELARSVMPAEVQAGLAEHKLVGRLGEPRDIADAVLFLLSDRSAFITGQVLPVDGGWYAHGPTYAEERRQPFAETRPAASD